MGTVDDELTERLSDAARRVGGELLGQALTVVWDGSDLVPIYGFASADGAAPMTSMLMARTADEAAAMGERRLAEEHEDGSCAALVQDAMVTLRDGARSDALVVDIHAYGSPKLTLSIALPYTPAGEQGGFKARAAPIAGCSHPDAVDVKQCVQALIDGGLAHEEGGRILRACLT